jgi:hypothetical protein
MSLTQGLSVGLVLVFAIACRREARAQVADDPLGPVQCFEIADRENLASTSAVTLCGGATSAAPGQCFADASDRGILTEQQMVMLCQAATSNQPIECFDRLTVAGTLTNDQMIGYCATRCPVGPAPPEAGNPDCVVAALDRADLPEQTAGELCVRARSSGPVDCLVTGRDTTGLADSSLVQLCAEAPTCQYFNAPPQQY